MKITKIDAFTDFVWFLKSNNPNEFYAINRDVKDIGYGYKIYLCQTALIDKASEL